MRKLLIKFLRFAMVSGVGWLIDFSIFTALVKLLGISVAPANYISSLAAVTFVFLVSTKRILLDVQNGTANWKKFIVYVVYQLVFITVMSLIAQWLNTQIARLPLVEAVPVLASNTKLMSKILITPITIIMNFFVLKCIVEGGGKHESRKDPDFHSDV